MASPRHQSVRSVPFPDRAELQDTPVLTRYLLNLICIKRSNLAVSADVHSTHELLKLAEQVGDHICILKTHADIIDDWSHNTIVALQTIAKRKHFLLFEDRKFGDIGNTLQLQYTRGPLQIATWAHLTNAHLLPGPGIVRALHEAADETLTSMNQGVATTISTGTPRRSLENSPEGTEEPDDDDSVAVPGSASLAPGGHASSAEASGSGEGQDHLIFSHTREHSTGVSSTTTISQHYETLSPSRTPTLMKTFSEGEDSPQNTQRALLELGPPPHARGLLLLAEMSSAGNLATAAYTQACKDAADGDREFVTGFISQRSLNQGPRDNFISLAPGVTLPPEGEREAVTTDGKGQRWRDPAEVVGRDGIDVIIVGRGILNAGDRKREARRYQKAAWEAYERRLRM